MRTKWMSVLALAAALFASRTALAAKAPADNTYEQLKLLVDILGYVQDNYVDEVDSQKLIYGAASGMTRTLDPYSQFLEPEMHREMKTETEGQFGGIGLRLNVKNEWLTVLTPMPGSPAYRLGILPNDRIVEIDGSAARRARRSSSRSFGGPTPPASPPGSPAISRSSASWSRSSPWSG